MQHENILNSTNKSAYARADVVDYFQNFDDLFPAEKVLFFELAEKIKGSKLLDIGIGGGRTTGHLLGVCDEYTGVDYVPQFARETAKKYPEARILAADARNLKEFGDEAFDFVLFSFNGIDCISDSDRLQALGEIFRVLKPCGTFMFSSHNRDYKNFNRLPWRRKIEFSAAFAKFFLYSLYHLPKHFGMKKYEVHTDDYAVVNDSDHRYSLLFYYIGIDKQIEQLERTGFFETKAYDKYGQETEHDTESHWIYYVATKGQMSHAVN